jgi:hypothetical protein
MTSSASSLHLGEFLAAAPVADQEDCRANATPAFETPGEGFVYLTVSSAMPGFVQLASSAEDPRGRSWSLRSYSGVTHFRTVCAVRTSDSEALEARFREALGTVQIPHHPDLFNIPLRFARQILEAEVRAFPSSIPLAAASRKKPIGWLTAAAAALVIAAAALTGIAPTRPTAAPAQSTAGLQTSPAAALASAAPVSEASPTFRPTYRPSSLSLR